MLARRDGLDVAREALSWRRGRSEVRSRSLRLDHLDLGKILDGFGLLQIGAHTTEERDAILRTQILMKIMLSRRCKEDRVKANLVSSPILLQPLVLAKQFCRGSLRGILLEALPEEVFQQR